MFPCRPADLQKHSQPNRPGHHSGSRQLWPRPGWSGSVQRAGPGDVWPAQTQVLGGGAETTAHDQESPQGLHSRRPEGNLLLVCKLCLRACRCLLKLREEVEGGQISTGHNVLLDVRVQEDFLFIYLSLKMKIWGWRSRPWTICADCNWLGLNLLGRNEWSGLVLISHRCPSVSGGGVSLGLRGLHQRCLVSLRPPWEDLPFSLFK